MRRAKRKARLIAEVLGWWTLFAAVYEGVRYVRDEVIA